MSELHQCKEELANAQEHIKRLERELDLCHEELRRCMRQANNKRGGGRKSRKARRGGGQGCGPDDEGRTWQCAASCGDSYGKCVGYD